MHALAPADATRFWAGAARKEGTAPGAGAGASSKAPPDCTGPHLAEGRVVCELEAGLEADGRGDRVLGGGARRQQGGREEQQQRESACHGCLRRRGRVGEGVGRAILGQG
jgi:hypothetical protein